MTGENGRANAREEAARGDECLAEARYLLKGGFGTAAVSRSYYAAYHWARALLFLKGLDPRTHRGVIQLLSLHYVRPGQLSEDAISALGQLETHRELSDYNAKATFDREQAETEVARAAGFIDTCRALLV